MGWYIYLNTYIPQLALGKVPKCGFRDLLHQYESQLSLEDWCQVRKMLLWIDLTNVRQILGNQEIDPHGMLTREELIHEMTHPSQEGGVFPPFVGVFLLRYASSEDRRKQFDELLMRYFVFMHEERGFLGDFFAFVYQLSMLYSRLRAQKAGCGWHYPTTSIDGSDLSLWSSLFPLSNEEDLVKGFEERMEDPTRMHRYYYELLFNKAAESRCTHSFGLDPVLAALLQVMIIEKVHREEQWDKSAA